MSEYAVYVLENEKGRLYIGHTNDVQRRLKEHNSPVGKGHLGKYTHKGGPWRLLGVENCSTRSEAMKREKELKSWKSPARVRSVVGSRRGGIIFTLHIPGALPRACYLTLALRAKALPCATLQTAHPFSNHAHYIFSDLFSSLRLTHMRRCGT